MKQRYNVPPVSRGIRATPRSLRLRDQTPHSLSGVMNRGASRGKCVCDGACPRCLGRASALRISERDEPLERQADALASQAMEMTSEKESSARAGVHRPADGHTRTALRMRSTLGSSGQPFDSHAQTTAPSMRSTLGSSGQPLDASTRGFFEERLGHDLSAVRIHTGTVAERSARALNARAYTVGTDVIFGKNQFSPSTSQGRRLIAHELAHVVQQQPVIARASDEASQPTMQTATPSQEHRDKIHSAGSIDDRIAIRQQAQSTDGLVLGALDLSAVPDDETELAAVKEEIVLYFDIGTVNAEVDVVLNLEANRRAFYTLLFDQNRNVIARKIGEQSQTPQLDPTTPSIARAEGYPGQKMRPLKHWLQTRYPALSNIEGKTAQELEENANSALRERCKTPQWFEDNYQFRVFSKEETEQRLRNVNRYTDEQLIGVKDFEVDELQSLELGFEPITQALLSQMQDTRLGRQDISRFDIDNGQVKPDKDVGGQTFSEISPPMIILYDTGLRARPHVFGSASGLHLHSSRVIAHETGHVLQHLLKEPEFAELLALVEETAGIGISTMPRFTGYADKEPDRESFAEAYSLFVTDPVWVQTHYPSVHAWFVKLFQELEKRRKAKGALHLQESP
jgi:Domain of unknown function (DUF4157)